MSELTKAVCHAMWEEHVRSGDHLIEAAERILEPLMAGALAMRNSYPTSQDGRQMWDEAVKGLKDS